MLNVEYLKSAKTIFWDFDGVIKDSVVVKSDAFESLFMPFGENIAKRVRKHHEKNGGMSRFDKLPIYLNWAGEEPVEKIIDEFEEMFSELVKQKVIDSVWVVGALDYLKEHNYHQQFFLITATPQQEIEIILSALEINHFFKEIVGAPTKKEDAIQKVISEYNITPEDAIMIGDSYSDYRAALENKVSFVLKKTELNNNLQQQLECKMIDNFL
jgi:phosphoglycolate phosphatase-like HAD superfamily hydrolase